MNKIDFNMNLPQPLKKEKINEYFLQYHNGDEHAKEIIIVHNIRLVIDIVNQKFIDTPYEKNELFSVGLIGLIISVETFKLENNTSFSTYATRVIFNEIYSFIYQNNRYLNNRSIEENIFNDKSDSQIKIIDTLIDDSIDFVNDYEEKEIVKIIKQLIEKNSKLKVKITKMYFGVDYPKCYTQREIVKELGCSQTYVCDMLNEVIRSLKIQLYKLGIIETDLKINVLNGTNKQNLQTMYKKIKQSGYDKSIIFKIIEEMNLSKRSKEVMYLYLGDANTKGLNQTEIRQKLNLSQRRVANLVTECLQKIELKLQELGILDTFAQQINQKRLNKK